jgi:hypothetical protein
MTERGGYGFIAVFANGMVLIFPSFYQHYFIAFYEFLKECPPFSGKQ